MTIEEMKKILAKEITLRELSRTTVKDRKNLKDKILGICSEEEKTTNRNIRKE